MAEGVRHSFRSRRGVAPKVAASVKSLASQSSASVKIGGKRWPYALGSNFGSDRYRQFPPFRRGRDYSLYRTIARQRERTMNVYANALEDLTKLAFPD